MQLAWRHDFIAWHRTSVLARHAFRRVVLQVLCLADKFVQQCYKAVLVELKVSEAHFCETRYSKRITCKMQVAGPVYVLFYRHCLHWVPGLRRVAAARKRALAQPTVLSTQITRPYFNLRSARCINKPSTNCCINRNFPLLASHES